MDCAGLTYQRLADECGWNWYDAPLAGRRLPARKSGPRRSRGASPKEKPLRQEGTPFCDFLFSYSALLNSSTVKPDLESSIDEVPGARRRAPNSSRLPSATQRRAADGRTVRAEGWHAAIVAELRSPFFYQPPAPLEVRPQLPHLLRVRLELQALREVPYGAGALHRRLS